MPVVALILIIIWILLVGALPAYFGSGGEVEDVPGEEGSSPDPQG